MLFVAGSSRSWLKDAIMYHILIDRFAGFDENLDWREPLFIGGNIQGIIEKLDYIKNLGVNTIWLSPFYETAAYHGYHITDFFSVDPHFGSASDIQMLVDRVHELDMRILADFVPNHCSKYHPFFLDAKKSKKSPYFKWFYFKRWPDSYLSFLSFPEIPKLNLEYTDARNHIIDAAKHWLSFGFDGFRLDHVIGPSHRFWKKFVSEVRKDYPDTVFIGEAWMMGIRYHELRTINMRKKRLLWLKGSSSHQLLQSYTSLFDGVLDFLGQQYIKNYVCSDMKKTKNIFEQVMKKHYNQFPSDYVLPLFLDNHDMDRFLFQCGNDKKLIRKAAEIQFSMKQPMIIYYGTEIGMSQEKSIWSYPSHGDIFARQPMQWKHIDDALLIFYQHLCNFKSINNINI